MLSWDCIGSLDELKQFDTYMLALNLWCNEQQKSGDLQIPQFGQPVCVRHKDTSQWRRAQVTRLSNEYGHCVLLSLVYHVQVNYEGTNKAVTDTHRR